MYRRRFFSLTLFTVLAIVIAAPHLRAADLLWNLSGTNTWTAANWGGSMPTVGDNLSFINPGADSSGYYRPNYSILQAGLTAYSQNVSLSSSYNDFVVLTINGGLFSPGSASINIGQRGAVNVDNGAWYASESAYTAGSGGGSTLNIFNNGYVLFKSAVMGSNASTTVDNGRWVVNEGLVMNATGANLTIRNGGSVSSAYGTITERSAATVSGAGSEWTMGGNLTVATGYGTGTVNISDGAQMQVGGVTYLGTDQHYSKAYINLSGGAGSRGVLSTNLIIAPGSGYSYGGDRLLTFDGGILQARSNQDNFLPYVESTDIVNDGRGIFIDSNGYDIGIGISLPGTGGLTKLGDGTLTLSGGGVSAYQGDTIIKNGTLALQRGHSTPSRDYIIGESSGDDGTLDITGVAVSNFYTLLGAEVGAAGTLKMNSGSFSSSGSLLVGHGGTGTLTMDGGSVSASTIIFGNNEGTGFGTINAGTLSASGSLLVERGSLTIKSGGSVSALGSFQLGFSGGAGSFDLQTGGSLASGTSLIGTGTATVSGGTWTVNNALWIGVDDGGTGTLTVSGGTVNVNAKVFMNSGGVGALSLTDESGTSGILSTTGIVKAGSGQASIAFNGGTLRAQASDSDFLEGFAPGEVTIGTRGAIIDTNEKDIGISTALGGSGGLTKTGSGTLELGGVNTYGGSTTITDGTVRLVGAGTLPGSALIVTAARPGANAVLDLNGRNVSPASLSLGGANTANTASVSSIVDTAGGGLLTLGGNVSFENVGNPLGSTISAALSLGAASRTFTVADSTTAPIDLTVSGDIGGGIGAGLSKVGTGTLLLSGANTYTGTTTVSQGTLRLGSNTALPNTALGVRSAVGGSSAVLDLDGFDATVSSLTIGGVSGGNTASVSNVIGTGTLTLGGGVTFDHTGNPLGSTISAALDLGGATRTLTVHDSATAPIDLTISGDISGIGAGLSKVGTGTLLLSGANTYTGPVNVRLGTLVVGSTTALPNTGILSVNANTLGGTATLDVNGFNITLGGLNLATSAASGTTGVSNVSGSGTIAMNGTIYFVAAGDPLGSTISPNINLGAASREIRVNDSTTAANDLTISGVISADPGIGFNKTNAGTLTLTGTSTYTGETAITSGTLIVNGDISSSSRVFIDDRSTLGGTGIVGDVFVKDLGIVAPGTSPGLLTIDGNLTMEMGSILQFELAGIGAGAFDQLQVNGLFNAAGAILDLNVSYAIAYGDSFHIFTGNLPTLDALTIKSNLGGDLTWDISQLSSAGIVRVVPEPSTWVLSIIAMTVLAWRLRRREA